VGQFSGRIIERLDENEFVVRRADGERFVVKRLSPAQFVGARGRTMK
jgi:hypothetical protein